jgi:hypothetical protein
MNNTASTNTGVCANFSKRFAEANTTVGKRGGECSCFDAEKVPEDAVVKERLVREYAELKAIVVCDVQGERFAFGYWQSPRVNGTTTVE